MNQRQRRICKKKGRDLELLVSRIKRHQIPDARVESPDYVPDCDTGTSREIDIGVHVPMECGERFIAIECRDRKGMQDIQWVEQLITKKRSVGADALIAVSSSSFSSSARAKALKNGVLLMRMIPRLPAEIVEIANAPDVTISYVSALIHDAELELPADLDNTTSRTYRHPKSDANVTFNELIDYLITPNLVRTVAGDKINPKRKPWVRFEIPTDGVCILEENRLSPVRRARLTLKLAYGEMRLPLVSAKQLVGLDVDEKSGATVLQYSDAGRRLSDFVVADSTGTFGNDFYINALLPEGKVIIGAKMNLRRPASITTMRIVQEVDADESG